MIWSLCWHEVAERDLRNIPWRLAATVDRAVMELASTGRGNVQRVTPSDPRRLRLLVPGAAVLFFADTGARTLYIGRVFRRV